MPSVQVKTDAITDRASQAFDYKFSGKTTFQVPKIVGLPAQYKIGLIVGPSGSGKTLLLKTFGKMSPLKWDPTKAICSHFPDFETAADMFSAVGLNSIPV
ncbi:unnamed protein product, partial [marine sediment metagenome]